MIPRTERCVPFKFDNRDISFLNFTGDPRRPYPLDFLMRRGVLGQISQSVGGDYSSGDELAMQRSSAITEEKPMQTNIGDAQTNRNSTGRLLLCLTFTGFQTSQLHLYR